MMLLQQHDGFPSAGLESRVNSLGFGSDFFKEMLVAVDLRAARRANLHKREAVLVVRIEIQEIFDSAETLDDSFRVVHPIHAHAEQASIHTQLVQKCRALLARGFPFRRSIVAILWKRHADRVWPHARHVTPPVYRKTVP